MKDEYSLEEAKEIVNGSLSNDEARYMANKSMCNNYIVRKTGAVTGTELKTILDYYKLLYPEDFAKGLSEDYENKRY